MRVWAADQTRDATLSACFLRKCLVMCRELQKGLPSNPQVGMPWHIEKVAQRPVESRHSDIHSLSHVPETVPSKWEALVEKKSLKGLLSHSIHST